MPLPGDQNVALDELFFTFGFATLETVQPGVINDSFSVTIQSADQQFTAVLATVDASGLVLAPPTPGGVVIDPATIKVQPVAYPTLDPALAGASELADSFSMPMPASFSNGPVKVEFDLFDNGDKNPSQAFYTAPTIAPTPVPEPSVLALLAAGGGASLARAQKIISVLMAVRKWPCASTPPSDRTSVPNRINIGDFSLSTRTKAVP